MVNCIRFLYRFLGDPWYDHINDLMEDVKVVGTESDINLEAIAALQPDLIIGIELLPPTLR